MSTSKMHINPFAKTKNDHENHKKTRNKLDKFAQKFSWVIVIVFSVSTFTALGLIFNEIKGNIGLAAQDLSAYNTWKVQYGLKDSDNDSNWNKSGDGVSNYNKYLLGLNLNTTLDGSVIMSNISTTSTSGSMPEIVGSKDPIVDSLQAKGPNIVVGNSSNPSTSGSNAGRTTTTTSSGNIQPNIGGVNSPVVNNPNTQVPILSNPTPSSSGKISIPNTGSSSSGTTIVTPNTWTTTVAGSSSSGTNTTPNSPANSPANTTSPAINNTATSNTVKTSGATASTADSTTAETGVKTSGTTAVLATKKTTTVRTGGEFNLILFLAGLASLASGVYILKNKFVKNSLAVHEGEK